MFKVKVMNYIMPRKECIDNDDWGYTKPFDLKKFGHETVHEFETLEEVYEFEISAGEEIEEGKSISDDENAWIDIDLTLNLGEDGKCYFCLWISEEREYED